MKQILVVLCLLLPSVLHAQQTDARNQLIQAEQLMGEEKYEDAVKSYQKFLEDYPDAENRDQAMLQLGQAYAKLARDAEARNTYSELIRLDPDGTYATSAVSYMMNLHTQRYQHEEAVRMCQQIVKAHPDTRAGLVAAYLVPNYLYTQGKIDEAIAAYRGFLESYPTSIYRSSVMSSLVSLYAQRKAFSDAEALIQEQLSKHPDDIDLVEYLAQLYQKRGQLDQALQLYQRVLDQSPTNTNVLEKIGEIYVERGDTQRAVLEWQRIVANNPNQYYQHQRLADIYKEHQLYDQAVAEYETAIRMQPRTSYLYTQLADVYRIQNDVPKAIETYVRALTVLAPNYGGRPRVYASLAELYPPEDQARAFHEAETVVRGLLDQISNQTDPQLAANRVNLLLAFAELALYTGDYEQSLERFRTLVSVFNDQGQALQQAAQELERRSENLAAARFYEEMTRLFPTGGLAHRARTKAAEAYVRAGHWNQALAVLDTGSQNDTAAMLLRAGIQLRYVRDVHSALATYERTEKMISGGAYLNHVRLGKAEAMLLLGEDAEPVLTSLLEAPAPYSLRARLLLGHHYFFRAEFDTAMEAYQQVAEIDTTSEWSNDALEFLSLTRGNRDFFYQPLALYAEGIRLEWTGNTNAAIASYMQVLEKFPKANLRHQTRMKLGDLYAQQEDNVKAEGYYLEIIAEESVLVAEAILKLASLAGSGDPEKAQQRYTQLLEQHPQSIHTPEARRQLRILLNQGKEDMP